MGTDNAELFSLFSTHLSVHSGLDFLNRGLDIFREIRGHIERFMDKLGMVYLFSLNRARADADVVLPRDSGRTMVCFGRVLLPSRPKMPKGIR